MPSRKRNKGKERRAKKEAAIQDNRWRSWAVGPSTSCNHGCVTIPPPGHAVAKFMNTFEEALCGNHVFGVLSDMLHAHTGVWDSDEHRQMAIDVLLSIGTNMILHRDRIDTYDHVRNIAQAILFIDCYDDKCNGNKYLLHGAVVKGPVIANCGGKRDLLKFFCKRIPCSCLKEMYKEARKTLPKMGKCMHCNQQKERESLRGPAAAVKSLFTVRENAKLLIGQSTNSIVMGLLTIKTVRGFECIRTRHK